MIRDGIKYHNHRLLTSICIFDVFKNNQIIGKFSDFKSDKSDDISEFLIERRLKAIIIGKLKVKNHCTRACKHR